MFFQGAPAVGEETYIGLKAMINEIKNKLNP